MRHRFITAVVSLVVVAAACTSSRDVVQAPDGGDVELTHVGTTAAPDFPPGLQWFNIDGELSLRDLRGRIVLLDFWTQGCINCIHVIPDLERLEAEHPDSLVVVGVHSAKFDREGRSDAIRDAVVRYGLEHPVVNDVAFGVWSSYGARAWPTTVLIDPEGRVVNTHAGEGVYEVWKDTIATMEDEYGRAGLLAQESLVTALEADRAAPSVLAFPGAVLADEASDRLYISDSSHHRVLVATLDGRLVDAIGGRGGPGADDGSFEVATFQRPQGLDLSDDKRFLYVADLENHLVRRVDLDDRTVTTVAGTGSQGFEDPFEPAPALGTPLGSPWDVLVDGALVHVAMSGQHQLWTLDTRDGTVETLAGTRREALTDGPLVGAAFNQPSGFATDGVTLWVTDPEASAVRALPLRPPRSGSDDREVSTVVGTGLFDWGDVDGVGDDVLLQHAIDVVHVGGRLFVTDTYNHKIKVLEPTERRVTTLAGSGRTGWTDGSPTEARFAEPSGISHAGGVLYVADTSNHLVRTVDLASGQVGTLALSDLGIAAAAMPTDLTADRIRLDPVGLPSGVDVDLELVVEVPDGYVFNELGPFSIVWTSSAPAVLAVVGDASWEQVLPSFPRRFTARTGVEGDATLVGEGTVFYCRKDQVELCLVRDLRFEVPVTVGPAIDADPRIEVLHLLPALADDLVV